METWPNLPPEPADAADRATIAYHLSRQAEFSGAGLYPHPATECYVRSAVAALHACRTGAEHRAWRREQRAYMRAHGSPDWIRIATWEDGVPGHRLPDLLDRDGQAATANLCEIGTHRQGPNNRGAFNGG